MAQPTTFRGSHIALFLEDLSNLGQFLRPCGLNNHTMSFSKNANEVLVPDCDDPDLPAWIERETESLDFTCTGSGILAAEAVDDWWTAFSNTDSINGRAYIGKADNTTNGRYWGGKLHLTAFEVTGERGSKAQISVTAVSDGALTFTTTT